MGAVIEKDKKENLRGEGKKIKPIGHNFYLHSVITAPNLIYSHGDINTHNTSLEKTSIWITSKRSIDFYFLPSVYAKSEIDAKKIAIVIGLKNFELALKGNDYILDEELIEMLFRESTLVFFLTKDNKKLFSYRSPQYQEIYGSLKEVKSLSALKRFGIAILEETIEKGSVTLHGNSK